MLMDGNADLLQIVGTLSTPAGFTRRLNGWQQQGYQDSDDRNHHQQLDECKRMPTFGE
jgi:hypothetical protein